MMQRLRSTKLRPFLLIRTPPVPTRSSTSSINSPSRAASTSAPPRSTTSHTNLPPVRTKEKTVEQPRTQEEIREIARVQLTRLHNGDHENIDPIKLRWIIVQSHPDPNRYYEVFDPRIEQIAQLIVAANNKRNVAHRVSYRVQRILKVSRGVKALNEIIEYLALARRVLDFTKFEGSIRMSEKASKELVRITLRTDRKVGIWKALIDNKVDVTTAPLASLRYALRMGIPEEVRLYDWSHMLTESDPEKQKAIMIHFVMTYSAEMIRQILLQHIKKENQAEAARYLELLIARFAYDKRTPKSAEKLAEETARLYEMICYVSVRLWNYQSILGVMEVMKINKVPITVNFLTILLSSMRAKGQHEVVLSLLRRLPTIFPDADVASRQIFANELIKFIRSRFPHDSKIVLAHFLAVYPDSRAFIERLGILKLIYRSSKPSDKEKQVAIANLDPFFQIKDHPSKHSQTELYASLIASMEHHKTLTPRTLMELFSRYVTYIQAEKKSSPLDSFQVDSVNLEIFVKSAIRLKRPSSALRMLTWFLETCPSTRLNPSLISYVFYHHGCLAGEKEFEVFMNLMAKYRTTPDFNLLAGLAVKDKEHGQFWFEKLRGMGYTADVKKLKQKAEFKGWMTTEDTVEDVHTEEDEQQPVGRSVFADEIWDDEGDQNLDFLTKLETALETLETKG